jgi:hypothetical protein
MLCTCMYNYNGPYFFSIHPRDKQDVALRLLKSGLFVAYKKGKISSVLGPLPTSVEQKGAYVTLNYDPSFGPLRLASSQGFEV